MLGRRAVAAALQSRSMQQWGSIALVVCGLVALLRPPAALPALSDVHADADGGGEGRIAGRPIAELWAVQRPAHAWFTSGACRPLLTRLACDRCLPVVFLASFPRSGNTWTRYLLEAASGLVTGGNGMPDYRQYSNTSHQALMLSEAQVWHMTRRDTEMVRIGYIAEGIPWTQGVALVAKTHYLPEPWNRTEAESAAHGLTPFPRDGARRAVLLIRDPFKAIISLRKYGETHSVRNEGDMTHLYRGEAWIEYAMWLPHVWFEMNAEWVRATNETYVVAYERLTRDTMSELRSLLRFLKVEPDERRMACLRAHLEGTAHNRRHGVVPDDQTYPLHVRARIWSYIHQLDWLLRDRGYPALPLEKYSFADEFKDIHL